MQGNINLLLEGRDESLTPTAYLNALRYFWGLLRDLDAAVSGRQEGSIRWEIESLSKNSPASVTFAGHSLTADDRLVQVERDCVMGLKQLSEGVRLPSYSDAAVNKALRLAKLRSDRRRDGLSLIQVFTDSYAVSLGSDTVHGIQALTTTKYESIGSIVGNLDSITVPGGSEFRVWEEIENRPVTCRFLPDRLELVKTSLGRRVLVYGDLRSNSQGQPTSVIVHGLETYPPDSELPSIEEMSGIIPDFTDQLPLGDYIEHLRHG